MWYALIVLILANAAGAGWYYAFLWQRNSSDWKRIALEYREIVEHEQAARQEILKRLEGLPL